MSGPAAHGGAGPSGAGTGTGAGTNADRVVRLRPTDPLPYDRRLDVGLGAAAVLAETVTAVVRRGSKVARPVLGALARPPLVPRRLQPATWAPVLAARGSLERTAAARSVGRLLDDVFPVVLDEVLRRLDLTEVVLRYVDVDRVVASADLDAAAARLDVEAVVDRLDLTRIVLDRVDLDRVVAAADLDAAAARLDVEAVVDRLDLTRIVLDRVDLDVLVKAVLEHIDHDDLVAISEEVLDAIDLPEIIRESTGGITSDTVREVRLRGISGDERVGRTVGRLLRRRDRGPTVPTDPPLAAPPVSGDA